MEPTAIRSKFPGEIASYIFVGDHEYNIPCRGFLSFNISPFIGIKLVDCSITMSKQTFEGDPTIFGPLMLYNVDWGAHPIELNDFDLQGPFIASKVLSSGDETITISSVELKNLVQSALDTGKERFQIKLEFNYPSTDSNGSHDRFWFTYSDIHFVASFTR